MEQDKKSTEHTLTKEQLLMYAAFDVKIRWSDQDITGIHFDERNDFKRKLFPVATLLYTIEKQPVQPLGWKLVLTPLSFLTTEIERGGEKFIPIVELAKIGENQYFNDNNLHVNQTNNYFGCVWHIEESVETVSFIFYYDSDYKSFYLQTNPRVEKDLIINNQFELFQKLLEWGFDIDDLIGKGLAVSSEDV